MIDFYIKEFIGQRTSDKSISYIKNILIK